MFSRIREIGRDRGRLIITNENCNSSSLVPSIRKNLLALRIYSEGFKLANAGEYHGLILYYGTSADGVINITLGNENYITKLEVNTPSLQSIFYLSIINKDIIHNPN